MNPGRELDALIAEKVMGWSRGIGQSCTSVETQQYWYSNAEKMFSVKGWTPSTDYSYALEVHSQVKTWDNAKRKAFYKALAGDDSGETWEDAGLPGHMDVIYSKPIQICLAALKVVGIA